MPPLPESHRPLSSSRKLPFGTRSDCGISRYSFCWVRSVRVSNVGNNERLYHCTEKPDSATINVKAKSPPDIYSRITPAKSANSIGDRRHESACEESYPKNRKYTHKSAIASIAFMSLAASVFQVFRVLRHVAWPGARSVPCHAISVIASPAKRLLAPPHRRNRKTTVPQ